jgi:hypothetical protein
MCSPFEMRQTAVGVYVLVYMCLCFCVERAVPPVRPLATPWAWAMPSLGEEASAMRRALVAKDRTLCLIILAVWCLRTVLPSVQLPVVERRRSSCPESKRSHDKADWTIAAVAGPITAPVAPPMHTSIAEGCHSTSPHIIITLWRQTGICKHP